MTKYVFLAAVCFLVLDIVLFFMCRMEKEKTKSVKEKLARATKQLNKQIAYNSKLESTIQIIKEDRENADKKIKDMRAGGVDGALDILGGVRDEG